MFLVIIPKQGKTITHLAYASLSVYATVSGDLLVVVDGNPYTYAIDDLECWNGYPSREAALLDGADLRDYPALK